MVAEINAARKANESLGGIFEVLAFGVVPGPRLARLLGGAPRRAARAGDHVDPGDEGRGDRRRVRPGRARRARRPTTRSSGREERGYYRETNRAGGIEGGMTTGDPVIVRGAMKPLPTLTKPLRSVDIDTKEPAAGAARAHRLVHRPGGRRGGGGDGRAGARLGLPGEVRRRPHRRRARRARRLPRADRMEARVAQARRRRPASSGRSCSWASWAPASPPRRARRPRELGVRAARLRPRARARLGEPIASFFDREGEAAFRAREEEVVLELLGRRRRRGGGARRRRRAVRAGARGAPRATRSCSSRCDPEDAWRRASGGGRPLARDQAASSSSSATASRSTRRSPTPCCLRAAATSIRARAARAAGARRGAARHAAGLGAAPPRATTRCSSDAG